MSETLESVERRLAAVERELAEIRARLCLLTLARETPIAGDVPMLREARAKQAILAAIAREVFAAMGISQESVGAESVRRRMLAGGIRPEDNAFSREIIAMREE